LRIYARFAKGWKLAILAVAGIASASCAAEAPRETLPPISIHGNTTTLEIAPVLLAARDYYPGEANVRMGGIFNLVGEPGVPGFSEPGVADVATHAETQGLRYSARHPNLRIILTVSEGFYRIVARRSAGIASLADLRGKRIATVPNTSSAFYLHKMLKSAGLTEADVTIVPVMPLSDMPKYLAEGKVDAVTVWEPEIENAAAAVGDDAIEFQDKSVYRELFNLNTTAENLADPVKRRQIVGFVRAVIDASAAIRSDPSVAWPLVEEATGHPQDLLARSWHHQGYPGILAPDLLDVLEEEEAWLAQKDGRPARSRDELARLIDTSVVEEAMEIAGGAR
jgi:sulfonate transport system substrate-binding protein